MRTAAHRVPFAILSRLVPKEQGDPATGFPKRTGPFRPNSLKQKEILPAPPCAFERTRAGRRGAPRCIGSVGEVQSPLGVDLAHGLEHTDSRRDGQIQAPGLAPHGNANRPIGSILHQSGG